MKADPPAFCNLEKPPQGWQKLRWYGPAFIWMISDVGSSAILLNPVIGIQYGYSLLWLAVLITFLLWIILHEIGRYSVITGQPVFEGYRQLPGPKNWAVWLLFLPQLAAAMLTVAGLGALAGNIMSMVLHGNAVFFAALFILFSAALVVLGNYHRIAQVATGSGSVVLLIVIATTVREFPPLKKVLAGLAPHLPNHLSLSLVIPWLSFYLAGAAGLLWFSYWLVARGIGRPSENGSGLPTNHQTAALKQTKYVKQWLGIVGQIAAIGVIGGSIINLSFFILSARLLTGLKVHDVQVVEFIARHFAGIWGQWGSVMLYLGSILMLWGAIIGNQDGSGRMLANATQILAQPFLNNDAGQLSIRQKYFRYLLCDTRRLQNAYILAIMTLCPLAIVFWIKSPIKIISLGGDNALYQIPVIVFLTLFLNHRNLPHRLRPARFFQVALFLAGAFYMILAMIHVGVRAGIIHSILPS